MLTFVTPTLRHTVLINLTGHPVDTKGHPVDTKWHREASGMLDIRVEFPTALRIFALFSVVISSHTGNVDQCPIFGISRRSYL